MVAKKLKIILDKNKQLENPRVSAALPLSKSVSNRVQIINALNGLDTPKQLISSANDSKFLEVGLKDFFQNKTIINAGEGGTTFRFLLAFFALHCKHKIILLAEGPMLERPINPMVESLNQMGCNINYLETPKHPPLEIKPVKKIKRNTRVSGSISSQFISAIAIASAGLKQKTSIKIIDNLSSESYLQLTIDLLNKSGCKALLFNNILSVEPSEIHEVFAYAEMDWSSAQYIFQLAALNRNCTYVIKDISIKDYQSDKNALEIFASDFGLSYRWQENFLQIAADKKFKKPKKIKRDFCNNPDLAQAWIITAFALQIEAEALGLVTLNFKETNRILALKNELSKIGAEVTFGSDWLNARGSFNRKKIIVETYNDHRMAMSFAPMVYISNEITINAPYVVKKSFQNFWTLFDVHCDLNFEC